MATTKNITATLAVKIKTRRPAKLTPEAEARLDKYEMLSIWHESADVQPDAAFNIAGHHAKLWGATTDEPWVTMDWGGAAKRLYPLRDHDGPATSVKDIIDARFRAVRDALRVTRAN